MPMKVAGAIWGLRRRRGDALPNWKGGWRGFMWKSNYPQRNEFCPQQGDRLKIWQEQDSGNWTILEGVIEEVKRFNYESKKEVERYFGDDPTYLWGEDQPGCGNLHSDSLRFGSGE